MLHHLTTVVMVTGSSMDDDKAHAAIDNITSVSRHNNLLEHCWRQEQWVLQHCIPSHNALCLGDNSVTVSSTASSQQ